MIKRLFIAAVGGLVVTIGLLFAMDAVTSLFRNETGERYFRITDILPKPPPGRPERPRVIRPPERVEPEASSPGSTLPIEAPTAIGSDGPQLEDPRLEPPELSDRE